MAPMEPNGYTTTFNRLIKEMLADQPQDFLEKTSFGKGLTEEDRRRREQREQERAEREAEREAEKEAANPTNKTTRYGGVIYFVFLDNYINDSEKKQVVKNANDILKANQIPAEVVGIQHPMNKKNDIDQNKLDISFYITLEDGNIIDFMDFIKTSLYRCVFLASVNGFEKCNTSIAMYGETQGLHSFVNLSGYYDIFGKKAIDVYENNSSSNKIETKSYDVIMKYARTALHELYHQFYRNQTTSGSSIGSGNHAGDPTNEYIGTYYSIKALDGILKKGSSNLKNGEKHFDAMLSYARLYQSGAAYGDWDKEHWQKKLDPQPSENNREPVFNIMTVGGSADIAKPRPILNPIAKKDRAHATCLYVSIDRLIMQFFFKYGIGTAFGDGIDMTGILNPIFLNFKEQGVKLFVDFYINEKSLELPPKMKSLLISISTKNNNVLDPVVKKDFIHYGKNKIKKY